MDNKEILIKLLVGYMVADACSNSNTGNWCFNYNILNYYFNIDKEFIFSNKELIENEFGKYNQVAGYDINDSEIELYLFTTYIALEEYDYE